MSLHAFVHTHTHTYKVHINMANYSKKLLQYVHDKLDKYPMLKNANQMIENATKKTKTEIANNITNSIILEKLRIKYRQEITSGSLKPLPEMFVHWWQLYKHAVGLHTMEKARQEVILLQNKLSKCRDIRHTLREEAFIINNKTKELYGELLRTKRDDPKYVTLTILENKTLQEQSKNIERLNLLEKEEKNYFIQLTTAFNQYQDAQSLNAQTYKYLSIFASVIAALLSFISTAIYHNQRINEIRQGILEMQEKSESNIIKYLEKYIGKNSSKTCQEEGWLDYTKNTAYTLGQYVVLKGILW